MKKLNLFLFVILISAVFFGCEQKKTQETLKSDPEMVKQLDDFLKKFEAKYIPLYKEITLLTGMHPFQAKRKILIRLPNSRTNLRQYFLTKMILTH